MTLRVLCALVRALILAFAWVVAAAGCGAELPSPTSVAVSPPVEQGRGATPPPEQTAPGTAEDSPPVRPASTEAARTRSPTEMPPRHPVATAPRRPSATATATPSLVPLPTPHPDNTEWVRRRIDALIALYQPTPAGRALLHSLDLRQMAAEPGFFGSYGFDEWAGVGEAKPVTVMHELGHSYWGGFPVIGRPDLGWQRGEGDEVAPALAAYHRDVLVFMAQPPDDYELLRQRLRNLPGLSAENTEPLFHSMEADVPHTTGGDLSLVPPILRKYWAHFLEEGPYRSWDNAAGWLQSLSGDERNTAGKYLGFVHLDLRQYDGLDPYQLSDDTWSAVRETLAGEERQRLSDFARNFDLLLGEAQLEENFQFWRAYLRDKVALFGEHPGHLGTVGTARASELSDSLKSLASLEGSAADRAATLAVLMEERPLLVNFLPALEDHTLVRLFASAPDLPEGPTLQATASFVDRLKRFGGLVEEVMAEGRGSPESGARALRVFLDDTGLEREQDLKLFFDLFIGTERDAARRIMNAVDKATIRALMVPVPVQLRAIFQPEELLAKLDVTAGASQEDLERGLQLLMEETSGNFIIDEPFVRGLHAVLAERARGDPGGVAEAVVDAPIILERFILLQPDAASAVLRADLDRAVDLVRTSDGVVAPPARIIYRLAGAEPALAAAMVGALDRVGERMLVAEALAYFAYDESRSERYPQLPISLAQDGAFLAALQRSQGADWLRDRLGEAVALFGARIAAEEAAPDFLERYQETLLAAAALAPDNEGALAGIVATVFELASERRNGGG